MSAHPLRAGRERLAVLAVAAFPLKRNWYLVNNQRRLNAAALHLIRFIAANLQHCVNPALVAPILPA